MKDEPAERLVPPSAKEAATGRHSPQLGQIHITWTDAEWGAVLSALIALFPSLGLPRPEAVEGVQLRHLMQAMRNALPASRHRPIRVMTPVRERLKKACRTLAAAPIPSASRAAPPENIVHRLPDGEENGPPAGRINWTPDEWYKIAVELTYRNRAFLETLNTLAPADVFRAQRVLPSNRRRPQTSFSTGKVRAELIPAFRRLRAAVESARREKDAARAAAEARAAEQEAAAAQAARQAATKAEADRLMHSPEGIAAALSQAALPALIDALAGRLAASAQGIIEAALFSVLTSERAKNALVVNIHLHNPEDAPAINQAGVSAASGAGRAAVVSRPKIGIVGALAQQGAAIKEAFPALKIKVIDKNLNGQFLKDAVMHCDRVIAMTDFISHSIDGVCAKASGDRYFRCHGGVSAVRHLISTWVAGGVLSGAAK